jgi:hypothetical protein
LNTVEEEIADSEIPAKKESSYIMAILARIGLAA